jgi:hypothetical protein
MTSRNQETSKKKQDQSTINIKEKTGFLSKKHQQPICSVGFPPSQTHPAAFISQPASMPSMGRSGGRPSCP